MGRVSRRHRLRLFARHVGARAPVKQIARQILKDRSYTRVYMDDTQVKFCWVNTYDFLDLDYFNDLDEGSIRAYWTVKFRILILWMG
jgi:hypothetical protein